MSASKIAVVSASAVAVLAALYAAAGYIAVPSAVKWAVGEYLPGPLDGKNATVESVSFNPWTLALELKNLKVESAKHPGANVLSLAYAKADASISSLFKMAPILDSLTVKSLIVDYDQTPAGAKAKKPVTDSTLAQGAAGAAKKANAESKSSGFSLPAFSLADVRLSDSSVRFRDSSQGIDMQATEINFELPLISTLSSSTDLPEMTPKLSLKLDGNPVTATGKTTKDGASLTVNVPELDAAKIIKALPVKLPVSVHSLTLGADITANYVMAKGSNNVTLSGKVHAGNVNVAKGTALSFAARALDVDLGNIDVFGQKAHVNAVTLSAPQAKGRLSKLMSIASADTPRQPQTRRMAGSLAPISPAYAAQSAGWDWSVGSIKISSGDVSVTDDTLKSPATLSVSNINIDAANVTQAAGAKTKFNASMNLAKGAVKASGEAQLATLAAATKVAISSVDLSELNPWIKHYAQASVSSGLLSTDANVTAAMAGKSPAVKVSGSMGLSKLDANYLATPAEIRLGSLNVKIKEVDTSKQTAAVSSVVLQSPSVTIARSAIDKNSGKGKSSSSKSSGKSSSGSAQKQNQTQAKDSAAQSDWSWSVGSIDLNGGTATLRDDTLKPAAALSVSQIKAKVQNLSSQKGAVSPYSLSATVAKGTFASEGKISLAPMSVTATNKMNGVQLPTFNPWLASSGASLTKGAASLNGQLTFKQATKAAVSWKGNMQVNDFNAKKGGTTVLSWDKAVAQNVNLQSVDPLNVSIELLEIDQPMQKMLKQEQKVGALVNLFTKGKHADKIEKFETKLRKDVKLRNLVYKDGKFSGGKSDNSLSSVLLKGLNSVFGK